MRIIADTRERVGSWAFPGIETIHKKVETGDYAIEGMENLLCLERKKTVAEIAKNMSEPRFKDVLARMQTYKYRFIILEFNVNDILRFPIGSGIPKSAWGKVRITPQYLMKFVSEIQVNHNVDVIFAGDRSNAIYIATNIIKRVYEQNKQSI